MASTPARKIGITNSARGIVNHLILIGIALGLAMDALSVAIGVSISLGGTSKRQTFRLAWHFGLFQALMPIIGWGR
jgi:putative Mn2+ efflux pump MntP